MAAVDDVFRFTLVYDFAGEDMTTTWYYKIAGTDGFGGGQFAENAAFAFANHMAGFVSEIQHTSCAFVYCIAQSYVTPEEYGESAGSEIVTGKLSGQPAPTFVAVSFRSNLPYPGTRRNYKRIGGLSEGTFDQNALEPLVLPKAQAIADRSSGIFLSTNAQFNPVVVNGPKLLGMNPQFYDAAEWFIHPTRPISTQNSRKVG